MLIFIDLIQINFVAAILDMLNKVKLVIKMQSISQKMGCNTKDKFNKIERMVMVH